MSEFVLLFRTSQAARQRALGAPERAQASMQAWLSWIRDLEAKGHLKDPGRPLDLVGRVVRGPEKLVTDGPYVEAKDMVLGFVVIEAGDLSEAVELASACPIVAGGGSVEVRLVGTSPS